MNLPLVSKDTLSIRTLNNHPSLPPYLIIYKILSIIYRGDREILVH
jgi:hypothetical protein